MLLHDRISTCCDRSELDDGSAYRVGNPTRHMGAHGHVVFIAVSPSLKCLTTNLQDISETKHIWVALVSCDHHIQGQRTKKTREFGCFSSSLGMSISSLVSLNAQVNFNM
jgi:hypothetical protein